jgi:class 3 adenylate cyclase
VIDPPETRYVTVGEAEVAYQVVGDGPFDLLYFAGLGSQVDLLWDYPPSAAFFAGLASISRLILFDRRGAGASDAVPDATISTWDAWTQDARAVLEAAQSSSAAVFAESDAGPVAVMLAATLPERVHALVLANTSARYLAAGDYPIGLTREAVDAVVRGVRLTWGTPTAVRMMHPDADARLVRWMTTLLRAGATPGRAAAQFRYILDTLDVREVLPLIQAPTLVLHTNGHPLLSIEHGRFLASRITGARLVELPKEDMYFTAGGYDRVLDEVTRFLTGRRAPVKIDRVLTTVLFTDIVESTSRAASMGDTRWRALLDAHDRVVRDELRRFGGREINTTGDGFVASFDSPTRAVRCAWAIVDEVRRLGLEVRCGLHAGECEVRDNDLGGLTVHVAARVGALARGDEILASSTVKDLLAGSGIEFADRGRRKLKGVPTAMRLLSPERSPARVGVGAGSN